MKNVSINKAVVLGIAVILVSIAFIPVVNAQNCNLIIRLPANPVTMIVDKTASNSYFDTTLSNVPSGYDVSNGDYLGWCIDLDHNIANNTSYQVSLYSSYNTSMPSYLWHNNLSKVNYILNNKQYSWQQVQRAMWYLLDFGDNGLNSYGWAMVNDAIANGSSFCPGVGDVIAIVADAGIDVQYTVIELQVPVYTLTVNTEGSGSVNPSAGTYASGNVVNVTATPDIGWTFNNWSGDVPSGHETDNPVTITMDSNKTITAHFTEDQYTLTIIIDGICGWVIKNPDYPTYPHGTVVMLTAQTVQGWSFTHWSGDLSGSNNPEYITMDSNKTVTAHFTVNYYTLNIIIDGNGTVNKSPDKPVYTYGANVTLTAVPDPGWVFDHWSGDLTGSNNPTYIKMYGGKTVTAHFTTGEYTLDINIDGNGYVIKDPDHATFPYDTTVELTAVPDPGWVFDHWSGDLTGSNNPETIFMDDNKTVTAHFNIAEPPERPSIDGPTNGKVGVEYEYTFTTIDPYESDIYYYIEWGDGDFEDWFGPYSSGEEVTLSHAWSEEETYTIQAKARNIYGVESDWATLEVEMPVNQQVINPLLQMILERFPNAFPILRQVLGL